ncbi:MAG: hypothetical protein LBI17_01685, partial [Rickettsiales bacterium]|nr:hypothetical protein [Rickettsiales bacterium]
MDKKKKRHVVVFTGIILVIAGIVLYAFSLPKESVTKSKDVITTAVTIEKSVRRSNNIENFSAESLPKPEVSNFRYKSQPLNFVYEGKNVDRIPHYIGTKRPGSDLDGLRIVCSGKQCERQLITAKSAKARKPRKPAPATEVVRGDVVFAKDSLKYLKSNVRIVGNLYIEGVDFIRIPKDFMVVGNVYITDSEGVTFMGRSLIDGNIFVRGRSSMRALPH